MKKTINILSITISSVLTITAFIIDLSDVIQLLFWGKIFFYGTPILILFCNMIYQVKTAKEKHIKEKYREQGLYGMFLVYLVAIFSLLFLAGTFRARIYYGEIGVFSREHFEYAVNLIPFESIKLYFDNFYNMTNAFMVNILGNLVLFAPMGFFINILFKDRIKNVGALIIFMVVLVTIIEFLQFVLFVGSADVDDVILNTIGAVVVYSIMDIKSVKNIVNKLLEW